MNFFQSQERARKYTTLLVVLFVLAVLALILMTNLLVTLTFVILDGKTFSELSNWKTFIAVALGVGTVVFVGSLCKTMALSAGGKVVAESLGGLLIPRNTMEPNQRKLLNVVDEMAIASGTPAPPVYLLAEEPGINAFAAGFSPRDAVIGITQGAIEQLNREQLQGVIAHEFSHIFNGDMRLNVRLMGALNGIQILGDFGYFLMRSASRFSGRRRINNKISAAMMLLGGGLTVVGFAGTFFGGLIKVAVSRQREYLADASAVQFTRNPAGIAGALKRIGGLEAGAILNSPSAAEFSHAFLAEGVTGFTQRLSSTHPPLASRILRIEPRWDGRFDFSRAPTTVTSSPQAHVAYVTQPAHMVRNMTTVAATMMDSIGQPTKESVVYARSLLSEMPTVIQDVREPYGARAVIYCLLLSQAPSVRGQQLAQLRQRADKGVFALMISLMPSIGDLDIKFRLPILDIAIPALKQLSHSQYLTFKENLICLVRADFRVDLFEWSLQKILFMHLDGHFQKPSPPAVRRADPGQLTREFGIVLSAMARAGAPDQGSAQSAFDAGAQSLAANGLATKGLTLLAKDQFRVAHMDEAFRKLDQLAPAEKSRLLTACAISTWHDHTATPQEMELLRAFASVLDCPMPAGIALPEFNALG